MKKKKYKAKQLDEMFERGEDLGDLVTQEDAIKRVNVDFPVARLEQLDEEAKRLNIPRQALIKVWLDQKFQESKGQKDFKKKAG